MSKSYSFNPFTGNFDLISEISLTAVGSTPNANGASLSADQALTLQPADDTNPGLLTELAQSIGGDKTFLDSIFADGGIDVTGTPGVDTLNIGVTVAEVINIGNSGTTINLYGDTFYQNVTNLNVANKIINLNTSGAAASGFGSGIDVEEAGIVTGYINVSADRNSWELKAPNTAGLAVITPGASGIVIDQSSHAPVTLTAVGASPNASGASLSGQALTLQPADGTNPGLLTSGSQTIGGVKTFNSAPNLNSLTASQALVLDGSKNITTLAFTSANTATTLVERDGSGNFSAGTITAALTGTASGNTTITPSNHAVAISSATNALSTAAPTATTGIALVSNGTGTDPSFAAVNIASSSAVTGTLAVANGGTGAATLTANNVILGNGTSAVNFVAPGTSGNVLTSNGTTWTSASAPLPTKVIAVYTDTSGAAPSGGSINYGTMIIDTDSAVTTGAGVWKFVVPVGKGGYYQISASVYNSAITQRTITINLNTIVKSKAFTPVSGQCSILTPPLILLLVAGDQIQIATDINVALTTTAGLQVVTITQV